MQTNDLYQIKIFEPASQKQIHALEEIADLKQHGKSIPYNLFGEAANSV